MTKKLKFTDQWLKALKHKPEQEQHFGDISCKGLSLKVTKKGVKSFSYTFRLGVKTGRVTLGPYPDISLGDVRGRVEELRRLVAAGTDPRHIKADERLQRERTVSEMATQFIERYAKPKNKSWRQAESNLRLYLVAALGTRPVASVKRGEIHAILDQLIKDNKGPSANRALAHMRKFFGWLVERDYIDHSPADHIKKPFSEKRRDRVLSDDEIKAIWHASEALSPPYKAWLRLSLLCGQREMETASMRRSLIEGDLWFLSSNDTKNKRENVLALPRQAKAIISELLKNEGEYLLSSGRIGDAPLNGFSKAKVQLDRFSGVTDWRLHDLRASVATNLGKLGYDRFTIKLVLNHKDTGVTAVYDRYTYLDEKQKALQTWADRLDEITR
ncbi:integrase arm-type DNA-binding domain-containing protein [Lentibacter algarum]|uniref:tyrosine-type recombinase/integrase n=1 Tax=Lentibacter algarum TaxID=576131 RepID=UPI00339D52D8